MIAVDWHPLGVALFLVVCLIATAYLVKRQFEREQGR